MVQVVVVAAVVTSPVRARVKPATAAMVRCMAAVVVVPEVFADQVRKRRARVLTVLSSSPIRQVRAAA